MPCTDEQWQQAQVDYIASRLMPDKTLVTTLYVMGREATLWRWGEPCSAKGCCVCRWRLEFMGQIRHDGIHHPSYEESFADALKEAKYIAESIYKATKEVVLAR